MTTNIAQRIYPRREAVCVIGGWMARKLSHTLSSVRQACLKQPTLHTRWTVTRRRAPCSGAGGGGLGSQHGFAAAIALRLIRARWLGCGHPCIQCIAQRARSQSDARAPANVRRRNEQRSVSNFPIVRPGGCPLTAPSDGAPFCVDPTARRPATVNRGALWPRQRTHWLPCLFAMNASSAGPQHSNALSTLVDKM